MRYAVEGLALVEVEIPTLQCGRVPDGKAAPAHQFYTSAYLALGVLKQLVVLRFRERFRVRCVNLDGGQLGDAVYPTGVIAEAEEVV